MKVSLLSAILATSALSAPAFAQDLTRLAAVPVGGEVTGLFLEGEDLFFNVQHPSDDIASDWAKATVGVIANANFAAGELPVPADNDMAVVTSTMGTYQPLIREGDFGTMGSIAGVAGEQFVSNDPDFNAFVSTGDNAGYLFTNWENRPGGISRVKMARAEDGTWTVDETDAKMLDFSSVQGTWVNCFGTLSPWGTPLSSEELYFDETADWNNPGYKYIDGVNDLATYLGFYPNPYRYGHTVEITDPAGAATPVKHYTMGRFSQENSVVMPDQKTAYISDDGTNVVFFKFVADMAGDLSSGTLYAAKMTQHDAPGTAASEASFGVDWIKLAHGTDAEIEAWVSDYDGITQDNYTTMGNSYITDAHVAAWAAGEAADDRAAFLETRKAALAKGATAEFRKMEGVNISAAAIDAGQNYVYMAMSEVSKGMSDDKGDIQVGENKCGVVYRMEMDGVYNITSMVPVVAGGPYDANADANACATDNISNPDNLLVLDNGDVIIGEDTGKHENNMIWLWKASVM